MPTPSATATWDGGAPQTPNNGLVPRLLGIPEVARYLGISEWSAREWVMSGVVPQVTIALPNTAKRRGGQCRRVLVDIADLDRLIEHSKECRKGA